MRLHNNYLIKNLFFFALAVLVSVSGISMAQFLLIDRDIFSAEISELTKVNQRFATDLEPVVKRRFVTVEFLAATSYPATALTLHMEKEFAKLLEKFRSVNDVDNILLFDAKGSLRAQSTFDDNVATASADGHWFQPDKVSLYWHNDKVIYLTPFFDGETNRTLGYLGGIVTIQEMVRHINSDYRERSLSQARLSPQIQLEIGPSTTSVPISPLQMRTTFRYTPPDVSLLPINTKTVVLLLLLVSLSVSLFLTLLNRSLKTPLQELHALMAAVSSNRPEKIALPKDSFFRKIGVEILRMHEQRKSLEHEMQEREVAVRLTQAAAQVAHDIRSPLAALNIAISELGGMPEKTRLLIRNAAQRINDIATELLTRRKEFITAADSTHASDGQAIPTLIFALLEDIVSEKRVEYQEMSGVDIAHESLAENSTLFARVVPLELKRAISNLVNNSVEAIADQGRVTIELAQSADVVLITVRDTGHGISEEILSTLLNDRATMVTDKGHGLGLQQARQAAESVGGTLRLNSQPGSGTEVIIELPRIEPPSWFASALKISDGARVVILDDDRSMHAFWEQRFEKLRQRQPTLQLIHFYHPDRLRSWWQSARSISLPTLFLVDYELDDAEVSGLDVVAGLEVAAQSVLVTSHHDDPAILAQCARMQIQIIPKSVVPYTPLLLQQRIVQADSRETDAILLDDEKLVRMSWQIMAEKHGINLVVCSSERELRDRLSSLPKQVPIYLDVHLNEPYAGIRIGRELSQMGFETIILTTGLDSDELPKEAWISKVIGKTPPWRTLS
jgi:signal transduction histidine kinase